MSQYLPDGEFQWVEPENYDTEEKVQALKDEDSFGYIFEMDLDYPADLLKLHNDYSLAPEKLIVKEEWLLEYAKKQS